MINYKDSCFSSFNFVMEFLGGLVVNKYINYVFDNEDINSNRKLYSFRMAVLSVQFTEL